MSAKSVVNARRVKNNAKTNARKRARALEEYDHEDTQSHDISDVLSGLDGYGEFMSDRNSGFY